MRILASVDIVNVVVASTLNQTLNLNSIVKAFPQVIYKPESFPGLIYKLRNPQTAHLIFSTGKMVCVGATSKRNAKRAVRKVIQKLKDRGILIFEEPNVKVVNIVTSANIGNYIDIERAVHILERTMYEPEQFPGLIHRMDTPKVVILLFSTGKLVVTGAKTEEDVYKATLNIQRRLEKEELIKF